MKRFRCVCGAWLFFESESCNQCGRAVGLTETFAEVVPFEPGSQQGYYRLAAPASGGEGASEYQRCANNQEYQVCNGFVAAPADHSASDQGPYCFSCAFNKTIPNLSVPEHKDLWEKMESAKRRTLYTIRSLGLTADTMDANPEAGLSFEFTADRSAHDHFSSKLPQQDAVMTGHDNGHITINLAEADEVARARTKHDLGEQYRTLLGHFRHEIGHYYFDRLIVTDPKRHQSFKALFGDDDQSYQQALDRHYQEGPPANWQTQFISAYATMHPWEDWAETWAHYLHMLDTLETAQSFGLLLLDQSVAPSEMTDLTLPQKVDYFHRETNFDEILDAWIGFSVVLNALNRSMGLTDAYPFVLNDAVREKLKFVHQAVQGSS